MILEIWKYSKSLFVLTVCFILLQIYFSLQFAIFSRHIDRHLPIEHPVATESFPFVNYNMYSGKVDDWGKYSYLKIEADGQEVCLTNLPVNDEEQILNPASMFLDLKNQNFTDASLYSFLRYTLDSSFADKTYKKASNVFLKDNPDEWGRWCIRYLSVLLNREVHSLKISNCIYTYDQAGKPALADQQLVYQYPK